MSIQYKNKLYHVSVSFQHNQRRIRFRKAFKSKRDAQHYEAQAKAEVTLLRASKDYLTHQDTTVKEAWLSFCKDRKERLERTNPASLKHHKSYQQKGDRLVKFLKKDLNIQKVTLIDVENYINHRRKVDKVTDQTIRTEIQCLSTMFTSLQAKGIKLDNPFRLSLAGLGQSRSVEIRLTSDQITLLEQSFLNLQTKVRQSIKNRSLDPITITGLGGSIEYEPSPKLLQIYTSFALAIETTLRAGVLFSLKWTQIKNKGHIYYLNLPPSAHKNKNTPSFLPLSTKALDILRSGQAWRGNNTYILGELTHDYAYRILQDLCHINNLPGIRWHDLRHEGISQLADKGWSVTQIQAISGHKTLQMLARYVHPDLEQLHNLLNQPSAF